MNQYLNLNFFPNNLQKNSLELITYLGKLQNSNKLYIEYSYFGTNNFDFEKKVEELRKYKNAFSSIIYLENFSNLVFRFVDDNGTIDDNDGNFYNLELTSVASKNNYQLSDLQKLLVNTKSQMVKSEKADAILSEFQESKKAVEIPQETTALVVTKSKKPSNKRHLSFSYKLNKRIKLALIKLFRSMPSFITGNYRRRINL